MSPPGQQRSSFRPHDTEHSCCTSNRTRGLPAFVGAALLALIEPMCWACPLKAVAVHPPAASTHALPYINNISIGQQRSCNEHAAGLLLCHEAHIVQHKAKTHSSIVHFHMALFLEPNTRPTQQTEGAPPGWPYQQGTRVETICLATAAGTIVNTHAQNHS